ncbi:MAG: zinc-dependent alcohol dehydrogenase family protein [Acidimicrobiales bacterium]|nr:zinc-dependent alcohol dehydrogenase family protein [Acidimicrobiales bacterium]
MDALSGGRAQRAAVLRVPRPAAMGPLELEDRPIPEPGPGEVLVEVTVCALCRTDLQLVEGDLPARRLPVVPGHQVVGRVAALGAGAEGDGFDLAVGSRVGIAWLAGACGTCARCVAGRENLCEQATFTGWDRDGGFARWTTADARFVHPIPDGFADLDAAPLLCGGAIGYRSLRVSGVEPGQRLGLYGFGASATVVIQLARHLGCEVFVATRDPAEQERAIAMGAVWAGGYGDLPPEPLDAAITFAPSGDVVVAALDALDRGGTVAVNAIHLDRIPEFAYEKLWWERSIRSVANVTRADVRGLLTLAAEIPLVTHHQDRALPELGAALVDLAEGRVAGAAVIHMF